jgi:hypothetical protein
VFQTLKNGAQEKVNDLTKKAIFNYSDGCVTRKLKEWWRKAEDYVMPDSPDDDDYDDDDNSRRVDLGRIAVAENTTDYFEIENLPIMTDSIEFSSELVEIDDNYVPINVKQDYLKPTDSSLLQFLEERSILDSTINEIREACQEKMTASCPNITTIVDPVDELVKEAEAYLEECRIQGELHSIDLSNNSDLSPDYERHGYNLSTPKLSPKQKKNKSNKLNRQKQKLLNVVKDVDFIPNKDNKMAIIPAFPRASAVVEEIIKQVVPYGSKIVGAIDDWVNNSKHRTTWHERSMTKNFFDRLDSHFEHNRLCEEDRLNDEKFLLEYYESFSNSDKIMPPCVEPVLEIHPPGTYLRSVPLPIINEELRVAYPYAHVNNTLGALEQKTELIKFYPLLFAINNFVSYANTDMNFVAAVLCRLLYPKTNGPEPGEWKHLIDAIQIFHFDFIPDMQAWYVELEPAQRAKVKTHLEALERGDKIKTDTCVFLKMQELLKKSAKGYGRLIFNVSTKYLLLLGDFLTQFSNAMVASLFPPVPTYTISKIACFHYASKFSDVNLNTFVNIAMKSPCGKFVLVLGDDTMIIDRDVGKYTEIDFTAYDSTQVRGGALDLFPALLRKMGCVEQADAYEAMYAEKIQWKHSSGMKIEMPKEWTTSPSRMSGEPGTSVANSYTTIMATKAVLEGTSTYARLGLVAKRKDFDKLETTFLKGIFLYSSTNDKWYWTRLPGFILKLKSFTRPFDVYNRHGKKKWSAEKCQQQLLWSQWLGFGNTQTNWFYVELTKIIRRLCPLATNVEMKEQYKVYTEEAFYIEDCEFDTMMLNRYGITRDESEDYLAFLNKEAIALPIIYQHSLTDKLIDIDA